MTERGERKTGSGIILAIYGTYRELEAWKKLERQLSTPETAGRVAELTEELNQHLIDYLLERRDGEIRVGRVELWEYNKPPLVERRHAFSRNKVNFLFPSPMENDPPFPVKPRLSDLRRPGVLADSLETHRLLKPGYTLPESRGDFVSRTVDELVSVEAARNSVRASQPGSPLIAHLRNLAEYLVAGRLLALNQLEPVPGLGLGIARNGDRISARIRFNGTVVRQNYPAQLFHRPVENTEAFIKAGVLFRDEVA